MDEPPQKRFRYATYTEQINNISVDTGKIKPLAWQENDAEGSDQQITPFNSELERLALLDLTLPFQELSRTLRPLTTTLPITLHSLPTIATTFHDFYSRYTSGNDLAHSGLDPALQLHRAIFETTLGEAVPYASQAAKDICRIASLRSLEPKIVERAYSTLSLILRTIASALLKPDEQSQAALRDTWNAVKPYLASDQKRYVRRCVADAWTGIVRKARADGLNRLVKLLLEESGEGMEAVWAHSIKGASGQLHSRALPVLELLLDDLEAGPTQEKEETLSKVITALVHHTTSTTFVPVAEMLVKRQSGASTDGARAILRMLVTALSVRKGKRYPESLIKPTMLKLMEAFPALAQAKTSGDARWRQTLMQAVIGSLMAGKLAQWLSPGVTLIEKFWDVITPEERFAFVNALIKLRWSGVEQFLIPHIARTVLPSLSTDPLHTLVLLNNLAEAGYLTGSLYNVQGGRWRQALVTALDQLLASVSKTTSDIASRRILGHILHLLPSMASEGKLFVPHIVGVVEQIVEQSSKTDERQAFRNDGPWNGSHLLSEALLAAEAFAADHDMRSSLKASLMDSGAVATIAQRWAWNREVMERIAVFAEMWQEDIQSAPWQTDYLYPNLLSSDSLLRLSSLRILTALSLQKASGSTAASAGDVWPACLAVEQSEMSLKNVRERTTEISRLTRLLTSLPAGSDEAIQHAITYLLSQLKVNFRPLYAETIKSLGELGSKHGEAVWEAIWTELEKIARAESAALPDIGVTKPSWANNRSSAGDAAQEEEEEPEYRCHNAEKSDRAMQASWTLANDVDALDGAEVESQVPSDRLDVINYEAQLLGTLGTIPLVAEKHTRTIVPALFAIANQLENGDQATLSAHLSTRQRQTRTCNWLELFAKFVNPKAAFRSDELHALYMRILSKGDVKLQGLAVSCLMSFKSPALTPYEDNLRHLLEDSKFRDELAHFTLGADSEVINPTHRAEILPVTIRLLYGLLTTRRGRSSAQGLVARKRAVLSALSGCSSDELKVLVDLMLEPFETEAAEADGVKDRDVDAAGRQQLGFLALLADVIKYLAPQTTEHWPRLIGTTVRLIDSAQARIDQESADAMDVDAKDDEVVEDDADEEAVEAKVEGSGSVPVRQIRSTAIKRLVQFLRAPVDLDLAPYLEGIFKVVISPRLGKLEVENTQAPSGVLDLIAAIAASPDNASALVTYDDRTLPKTFACFTAVKVKPAVIARVFDIIESLLERDTHDILLAHVRPLLDNVIRFVEGRAHAANDDLMRRLLTILSRVSAIVTDGQQAQQLASLLCPMLRAAGKQQPEKMKVHVLNTLQRLFTISPDFADLTSTFFTRSYDLLSNLLQTAYLPSTRRAVVAALQTFATSDSSLERTIQLVSDLNSYSARRMDEPDFDKRLTAFASLNDAEEADLPTTIREWMPLLRSALFFIKDPEELSLRTNSSALMKRFIDLIGPATEGPFVDAIHHVVLPGLRQSLRSKLELVRNEALVVLAYAVKVCDGIPVLVELRPLTGNAEQAGGAGGEDDTSFFVNISHIQVHRRARALRRLRDTVAGASIRETSIANFFLPILEHIIAGATEVTDHHFVNEAISTVGSLAGQLKWSRYNGVLTRYLKLGSVKSAQQKVYVRTVSAIIDHFHFDLLGAEQVDKVERDEVEVEADEEEATDVMIDAEVDAAQMKKISEVVLNRILPSLSKFVSQKDENDDTIRIPLALPTVKLASQLPDEVASNEIIRVVTIVSQILRSKDQDTRDIARDTIGKIAVFLGPSWLVKILGELQTALQRGPQKHVAGVVTHSILSLATTDSPDRFSDLDEAVNDAVRISAEVVWGESGKDASNEGYKTKMREVRGATSRGFDTFQLLARLVSPAKIGVLIAPIREVMHASQAVKTMTQVDEALRRVALGLNANEKVGPEDVLTLCYSLVSGNSAYLKPKKKSAPVKKGNDRSDAFKVQMKRNRVEEEDFYHLNAHKFVSFGLDLFVTAFRRGRFAFDDTDILSRLGPLVSAIGNTLYSPTASVLILGLKASAAIVRCPLKQVEESLPAFIGNIFKILKHQGGTAETDIAQTALKTLAVILRDCKASVLADGQLRTLLEIISPDLEEPDRQAAIFAVLRAIVSRKMVVPEIYDLMSTVSGVMVTSQSTHVQDQCRGVLIAFLLDYPQGKNRVKTTVLFLARNLEYVYPSGRVSVLEFLNAVFTKFSEELMEEYAEVWWVSLTAVIANDESEKCRVMAGELVRVLVGRLEDDKVKSLIRVLGSWIDQRGLAGREALAGASFAVWGLVVDLLEDGEEGVQGLLVKAGEVISESAEKLARAEAGDEDEEEEGLLDFTLPHHALSAVAKALKVGEAAKEALPWDEIVSHLLFPHDWVRLAAVKCIVAVMASDASAKAADDEGDARLTDAQCLDAARKGCLLLQGSKNDAGEVVSLDTKLADLVVKMLWNVAKRWSAQNTNDPPAEHLGEVDDPDAGDDVDAADEAETAETGGSLSWLMSRVSFVARHIIVHRPSPSAIPTSNTHWTSPLLSILRFFAGVMEYLDRPRAEKYLVHVLSPIYRVLDEGGDLTAEHGQDIDDLRQLATEVRDLIQSKVGTSTFSRTWEGMRSRVVGKREERRDARNRLAFTDPKAFADRRSKKVVQKKDSKKRRVKAFAEGRVQSNHLKRRS